MHIKKSSKSTIKLLNKRTLILVTGGNGSGNDPGAKTKAVVAPEVQYYEGLKSDNKK
ncbi:hypothetical protein [Pseudoalteromonas 'SMAR']|uniref:hypothetical protein n=1 Tax=Pseudoalteromonas 'SMAR' TaxID=3416908 RepID=UPI003AF2D0B5